MNLNCIAIDDEVSGLETIHDYISYIPQLKLIDKFSCPEKALAFINSISNIDILFLDIEMPNISGMDLLKLVKHKVNSVIFTTAHLKYIIDSYNIEADGFLLKPYSYEKFEKVVKNLFWHKNNKSTPVSQHDDYIFIKIIGKNKRLLKVRFADIVAVEALRNYISIHTVDETIKTHLTISKMKEILAYSTEIIQVHRSFLISSNYIEEVKHNVIRMQGNIKIAYGEKYKDNLLSFIRTRIDIGKIKDYENP